MNTTEEKTNAGMQGQEQVDAVETTSGVILRAGVTTSVQTLMASLSQELKAHSLKKIKNKTPSEMLSILRARHLSLIADYVEKHPDADASRCCETCSETFYDPEGSRVACPFCGRNSLESTSVHVAEIDEQVAETRRESDLMEVLNLRHDCVRESRWALAVALYTVRALEKWRQFGYGSFHAYLQNYYAQSEGDGRPVSVSTAEQLSRIPEHFSREDFLENGHKKLITIVDMPHLLEAIAGKSASEVREIKSAAQTSSSTSERSTSREDGGSGGDSSTSSAATTTPTTPAPAGKPTRPPKVEGDPLFHVLTVKVPRKPWTIPLMDRRTGQVLGQRRSKNPDLDRTYFDLPLQGTDYVLQGSFVVDAFGGVSGLALEVREFESDGE